MGEKRIYDLEARLVEFVVMISDIIKDLPKNRIGNYIAGQLTRSGFSPAFNYAESQSAESRQDFIHKVKIVLKELRETLVALKIIHRLKLSKLEQPLSNTLQEANELIAIFVKSVET